MAEGTKDVSQAQIRTDLKKKDRLLIVNEETKEVQQLAIEDFPSGSNPDEEDITLNDTDGLLQFKDREYQPEEFSGLGTKILRKNFVGVKNILTAEMIQANSIIEIRYDYDLNGATIILPQNVTFKFAGGSLRNGTITGNKTKIEASLNKIFFDDLIITGKWATQIIYPEWFGAIGYEQVQSPSWWWWNKTAAVVTGIDSTKPIIKGLGLASISCGVCSLSNGAYKVTGRVDIPMFTALDIAANSGVRGFLNGDGLTVVTSNKETGTVTKETFTTAQVALKSNQYFDTTSLKILFDLNCIGSRITGRGIIALVDCTYTIGIYVRPYIYEFTDMTYAPTIDVKIFGGLPSTSYPDPDDLVGAMVPTPELGTVGQYYYNTTNKNIYRKSNTTTWVVWKSAACGFNTSVRLEAKQRVGNVDERIINTDFTLYDIFGFRGIEYCTEGSGWINQSIWKGTISNKAGSYISMFNGCAKHDFTAMSYQCDGSMASTNRLFYVGGMCGYIQFGNTWDLSWNPSLRTTVAYEIGKNTKKIEFNADGDSRFVQNDSNESVISGMSYNKDLTSNVSGADFKNILKYRRPTNALINNQNYRDLYKYTSLVSSSQALADISTFRSTPLVEVPSVMFDEDVSTYMTAVDTVNMVLGSAFALTFGSSQATPSTMSRNCYLVIDYTINAPSPEPNQNVGNTSVSDVYVSLLWNGGSKEFKLNSEFGNNAYFMTMSRFILRPNSPIGINFGLYFYTKNASLPQTLEVRNIKLMIDQNVKSFNGNVISGLTSNRPDAVPKGHIYEDTTLNATLINTGTSAVQVWNEIPKEVTGVWTITTGGVISSATANYSKIGKQINLSGTFTIAAASAVASITLPFTPNYGGIYVVGDLTITLTNNSATATIQSATAGAKPFQLNFKTS